MPTTLSRQSVASIAQLLSSLSWHDAELLLYKHLEVRVDNWERYASHYLRRLESSGADSVLELIKEVARESDAFREQAPTWQVFDAHLRTLRRWLLHDGWIIENGQLVRVAPAAEEATGVRDDLIEQLGASGLDDDGGIRKCIQDASEAFTREPPDFNGSTTNVRVALETVARSAARKRSASPGIAYPKDSWGAALVYLRQVGVLDADEEGMMARVYTFISPGAHVPAGISEEEWARLARTFGLGAAYFLLKKHLGQS